MRIRLVFRTWYCSLGTRLVLVSGISHRAQKHDSTTLEKKSKNTHQILGDAAVSRRETCPTPVHVGEKKIFSLPVVLVLLLRIVMYNMCTGLPGSPTAGSSCPVPLGRLP